jgi:hypothetical protein
LRTATSFIVSGLAVLIDCECLVMKVALVGPNAISQVRIVQLNAPTPTVQK